MLKLFKDRFLYDWYKYILVVLVSIGLWSFIFNIYHMTSEENKISIFYAGNVLNQDIENDLMIAYTGTNIEEVSLQSMAPDNKIFNEKYTVVALSISDIVIVPEDVASSTALSLSFKELSNNYDLNYYVQESKNYGLVLNNKAIEKLDEYFEFSSSSYVLLFSSDLDDSFISSFIGWLLDV